MRRYILTGAPGSGKTAIIRQLELEGFSIVEEAATDVIASRQAAGDLEPWTDSGFIDAVAALQRSRQLRAEGMPDDVQFHDRSVICTWTLAAYQGRAVTPFLKDELERVESERVFDRRVLFVRNQGFVTATPARRISLEDSLVFERVHEETYRALGYELLPIPPGTLASRVAAVLSAVGLRSGGAP